MVDAQGLLAELREWALDKSSEHHRLAHDNEHLRTEHIASSSAYRSLAEELAERAPSKGRAIRLEMLRRIAKTDRAVHAMGGDLVERVAIECHHASCANIPHHRPSYRRSSYPWDLVPETGQNAWRAVARAAIAAAGVADLQDEVGRTAEDAFLSGWCGARGEPEVAGLPMPDYHAAQMAAQDYCAALTTTKAKATLTP